jgi:hypothetical protein
VHLLNIMHFRHVPAIDDLVAELNLHGQNLVYTTEAPRTVLETPKTWDRLEFKHLRRDREESPVFRCR